MLVLLFLTIFSSHAKPPKASGFIDTQLNIITVDGSGAMEQSGFIINDGSLIFDKYKNGVGFELELAFTGGDSNSNSLSFAQNQSQVILNTSGPFNLALQIGQFDKIFGPEANDSRDRFFAPKGLFLKHAWGTTHLGIGAAHRYKSIRTKYIVGNPMNRGTFGDVADTNTANGSSNFEYGAQISGVWGVTRFSLTHLTRAENNVNGAPSTANFTELLGIFKFTRLSLIGAVNLISTPSLDADSDGDFDGSSTGIYAASYFNWSQWSSIGARVETITNFISDRHKETQISVGYRRQISKKTFFSLMAFTLDQYLTADTAVPLKSRGIRLGLNTSF
jgi:hypothetical protein